MDQECCKQSVQQFVLLMIIKNTEVKAKRYILLKVPGLLYFSSALIERLQTNTWLEPTESCTCVFDLYYWLIALLFAEEPFLNRALFTAGHFPHCQSFGICWFYSQTDKGPCTLAQTQQWCFFLSLCRSETLGVCQPATLNLHQLRSKPRQSISSHSAVTGEPLCIALSLSLHQR